MITGIKNLLTSLWVKPSDFFVFKKFISFLSIGFVTLVLVLSFLASSLSPIRDLKTQKAEAATSSTLNFQARLLNSSGNLVADGYYNIRFKLYDGGTQGGPAGKGQANTGTQLWTESYYDSNGVTAGNDNRVRVTNGYFSVSLGSQTAFPSINWDEELWLTMDIGGTTQTATPTYDGEMLSSIPAANSRLKLTAVPYAFRAGQLAKTTGSFNSTLDFAAQTASRSILLPDADGTVCLQGATACGFAAATGAAGYIQNGTSLQTNANFNIQSASASSITARILGASGQTADIFQARTSGGTVGISVDANGYFRANAGALITPSAAGFTGLLVQGLSSQTADIFQVKNSGNTNLLAVAGNNEVKIGGDTATVRVGSANANVSNTTLNVSNYTSAWVGISNQAASGQTGDLYRNVDSNRAVLSGFNANGGLFTYGANNTFSGLATPAFTTSSTGTSYYYVITATNAVGETVASTSLGMANNTSALAWSQVAGATGYKIYRNTTNSFTAGSLLLTTITNGTTVGYTDTGSATGAGLPPTTPNGTTLTLQAWANQGNAVLQTQNSAGTTTFSVTQGGGLTVGTGTNYGARLNVTTGSSSSVGAIIRGFASQTADLLQLQDSSGAILTAFQADGKLVFGPSGSQDTNLYRSAADTLKTDDSFIAGGNITAGLNGGSLICGSACRAFVGGTADYSAFLNITIPNASSMRQGIVLRGASSQTANLIELQDSNGIISSKYNTAGNQLTLGTIASSGTVYQGQLTLSDGTTSNFGLTLQSATLTANRSISLPDENGTVCLQNSTNCGFAATTGGTGYIQNGTSLQTANFNIQSAAAGSVGAIVQGHASQTADIFRAVTSTGTGLIVTNNGESYFTQRLSVSSTNLAATVGSKFAVGPGNATTIGQVIRGFTSQTADLLQLQDSTGAILTSFDAAGKLVFGPSGSQDTNLYRSAADTLRTDDNFYVTQNLAVNCTASAKLCVATGGVGANINVTGSSDILQLQNNGTNVATVGSTGAVLFQNSTNSTSAFQIQNAAGEQVVNVDTVNTANLITNYGFETNTTGWVSRTGTTLTRTTNTAEKYQGVGGGSLVNTATANAGVNYPYALSSSTAYTLTFYARLTTGSMTTLQAGRADNGSTDTTCTLNSATLSNAGWTRYSCTFTTGTTSGSPYIFIRQSDAVARTMFIDNVQLVTGSSVLPMQLSGISLNGIVTSPMIFQNSTNSTTAFQIQNAAGTGNTLVADTLNNRVGIGRAPTVGYTLEVGGGSFLNGDTLVRANNTNRVNAFQVQNSNTWQLFNVDTTYNGLISNPGFEVNTTGWANRTGGTITRITTPNSALYYGVAAGQMATTATANAGASFAYTMTASTQYTLSFYARASGSNFSTLSFGRQDVSGTDVDCSTGNTVLTTGWTRYSCTFTTGGTITSSNIYFKQSDATARTFYVDGFKLEAGATATPYTIGNISLRGTINTPANFQSISDSTTAFQVQNAAGTSNLFVADTTNSRVGVGATPANGLLTVGTNTTTASGGIYFGTDTNLYRLSTNYLRTDSDFEVGGTFVAQASTGNTTQSGNAAINGGAISSSATTFNLLQSTVTTLNIGGVVGAGGVNIAGGSGSTGCTIDGSNGNLTCSGAIATTATSGTQGWWNRSGTTLQPTTAGDNITTTGNISTTSSGTITSAGLLTGSAGLTVTGTVNLNSATAAGAVSIGNNTGNTAIAINSGTGTIDIGTGGQARSVNLGTGAAAQTVAVGSSNGSSSLSLQAGTNGVNIATAGVANTIQIGNTSGGVTQAINIGNNSTASSTNNVNIGSSIAGTTAITGATTITNRTSGSTDTLIISNSTSTGNILQARDNTTAVLTIADGGATTFSNTNTSAFVIQNASSQSLFVANTSTQQLAVGPAALAANGVLTVGTNTTANTGGIWFGTDTNLYRGAANQLRTDDDLLVRTDSTNAFQVQNVAGASFLNINTIAHTITFENGPIDINGVLPPATATVTSSGTGGTLAAGTYCYRVVAYNAAHGSNAYVSSPANGCVTTTGSTSRTTITWTASPTVGVIGYGVIRSTDGGFTWNRYYDAGNTFTLNDTGSTPTWTVGSYDGYTRINYSAALTLNGGGGINFDGSDLTSIYKDLTDGTLKVQNLTGNSVVEAQALYFRNTTDYGYNFAITGQGQTTFQNSANSTTAFQIQNTAADSLFIADTTNNKIKIGNSTGTGTATTIFQLDGAASAPFGTGQTAYLGSMYYDTTQGKLQCYEDRNGTAAWGACGSAPNNIITLTPEYTGAVLNGSGVGTMTADFCSNESGVLVVGTLCANHETRNFYKWTSPQGTNQTYSIYVNYKLPTTFNSFEDANTIKLTALSDNLTNASATLQVLRKNVSGNTISSCGSATTINSTVNTWQQTSFGGNETTCGFVGGDYVIFKIDVTAKSGANIYVENLDFTYRNT